MSDSQLHLDSYYAASANHKTDYSLLEGEQSSDVCVIGGGITGLSSALHLTVRGYKVILFEANRIGWGASGRNGGQCIFGYGCEMEKIRKLVGIEQSHLLWDMSIEAIRLTRKLINEHEIECDWTEGHMHAALKQRHHRELEHWRAELSKEYGYEKLQIWSGKELKQRINSNRYVAGLYDPESGHLHPLNYTLGIAIAAEKSGAQLHEQSFVLKVEEGDEIRIFTSKGVVKSKYLILAGNAYLGQVGRGIQRKLMPVGTYIGATVPLGEDRAKSLISNNMAVADINFVLDYYRLSSDFRMLFGGKVSYSTIPPLNLAQSMKVRMQKVFPQLEDVSMEYAWGGLVGITMNRAPHFGRLEGNIFFAQGFSGHGVALAGLAGKLMSEAVAGTAERFDVFSRIPHLPFPGGNFMRMPVLVLAMSYFRIRDLLP